MNELMASAYAAQNGDTTPHGYPAEKTSNLPTAEAQPQLRSSVASWLRRHHPLNLNPPSSARSSAASAARTTIISQVNELPPPPPILKTQDKSRLVSVWSESTTSSDAAGSAGRNTAVPSFYGERPPSSRYLSGSVRGTWALPSPGAGSTASRDRESGGMYV